MIPWSVGEIRAQEVIHINPGHQAPLLINEQFSTESLDAYVCRKGVISSELNFLARFIEHSAARIFIQEILQNA